MASRWWRIGLLAGLLALGGAAAVAGGAKPPAPPRHADETWTRACDLGDYEDRFGPCNVVAPLDQLILLPAQRATLTKWRNDVRLSGWPVWEPLAGDMLLVVATEAIFYRAPGRLDMEAGYQLSDQALIARARANTDRWSQSAVVAADPTDPSGVLTVSSPDISAAALSLSPRFWKRPEFARFVGVPVVRLYRDETFFVADSANPAQMASIDRGPDMGCVTGARFVQTCSLAGLLFTPTPDGGLRVWPTANRSPKLNADPFVGDIDWMKSCRVLADRRGNACISAIPSTEWLPIPMNAEMVKLWSSRGGGGPRVVLPLGGDMVVVVGADLVSDPPRNWLSGGASMSDPAIMARARRNLDVMAVKAGVQPISEAWEVINDLGPANALVLSPLFWKRPEFAGFKGRPVVFFSDVDSVLIADEADPKAVGVLVRLGANHCFRATTLRAPTYCSSQGWLYTPDGHGGLKLWGRIEDNHGNGPSLTRSAL